MKTINLFKQLLPSLQRRVGGRLLLLLGLIVAGVQSAQADYVHNREWVNKHADVVNVSAGGVTYEVCHIYWKIGYVDQNWYAEEGYYERQITSDDSYLLYITTNQFNKPDDEYYASVVAITGSGEIVIQDSINNGGRKYPVKYIGRHTEQTLVEKDTTYFHYSWMSGQGTDEITTCKYYGYTQTPVSITNTNVTKLTVNGNVEFLGNFSLTSCRSVEFNKDVTFSTNVYFNYATSIVFNDYVTISQAGMLSCNNATTLKFNGLTHEGKIQCNKLTDIYYQNNLPPYSGSFSNYFTNVSASQITAHVANKTSAECQTIHSSWAVYASFGNVVPYTAENPKHTVHVTFENARAQITYTKNGNTFTSTYETSQNITVDGSSDLVIRPYKNYNNLGLASVKLNGAEIIYDLTGSGTMYDAYTISGINSDVYLTFAGVEIVKVNLTVEASAPRNHFITNNFWVRPNYGETDNLFVNQSASFTVSKHGRFFFEMDSQEDPIWGIIWNPIAVYVNGKDRTEDIVYDMSTYFELENLTSDTEIRVVFGPNCDFVSVVSLGPDLLWDRFDGDQQMIDCSAEHYYVPVLKDGKGVKIRTNLLPNQTPENYDVMYMYNYGMFDLGEVSMDQGGVELMTDDNGHKNFQFKLLPNVKDQDRVIGIYPKATVPSSGSLQTIFRHGGNSVVSYEYEDVDCTAYYGDVNEGEPVQYTLPPFGDDCATYYNISIHLLDGETFKAYRNGVDYTDRFLEGSYNEDTKETYYSFDDVIWKDTEIWPTLRYEATWEIILEEPVTEQTKWTVLQTGGFEGAEMVVTANDEDETISCTGASTTQAFGDDVTKVRLVVPVANNQPYQVKLEDCGSQKLAVIKLIREIQELGLAEAKYLADNVPIMLTGYGDKDDALSYVSRLKALGATAEALAVKVYCDGVDVTSELTTSDNMTYIEKTSEELVTTNWIINSEIIENRFDTNNDGTVNISDVTKLVNEILGQSPN